MQPGSLPHCRRRTTWGSRQGRLRSVVRLARDSARRVAAQDPFLCKVWGFLLVIGFFAWILWGRYWFGWDGIGFSRQTGIWCFARGWRTGCACNFAAWNFLWSKLWIRGLVWCWSWYIDLWIVDPVCSYSDVGDSWSCRPHLAYDWSASFVLLILIADNFYETIVFYFFKDYRWRLCLYIEPTPIISIGLDSKMAPMRLGKDADKLVTIKSKYLVTTLFNALTGPASIKIGTWPSSLNP